MGALGKLKKGVHFVGTGAKWVATSRPAKGLAVAAGSIAGLAKYPVAVAAGSIAGLAKYPVAAAVYTLSPLAVPIAIAKGAYDTGAETWQMVKTDPVQKAIDNYKFQPPLTPATHLPFSTTDKKGQSKIEVTSARQAAEKLVTNNKHHTMANLVNGKRSGKSLATDVGRLMDDLARAVQTAPAADIDRLVTKTQGEITNRITNTAYAQDNALIDQLGKQAKQLGELAKNKPQRKPEDQKAFNSAYDYLADYCRKNPKDQDIAQAFNALLAKETDPQQQLKGMQEQVKEAAKKTFDKNFASDGKIKVSMDGDFNFSVTHPQNSNEPGAPLVNQGKNQKIEAMLEMIKAAHAAGIEVEIEITGGSAKTREKLATALHAHSKNIGVEKPNIKMGQTEKAEDLKSFTGNKESQKIEAKFQQQKAEHQANQLIEHSKQLERRLKQETQKLEKLTSGNVDAIVKKLTDNGIITAGTPAQNGPPPVAATPATLNPDTLKNYVDLDQYKELADELKKTQAELQQLQTSHEYAGHASPANQAKLQKRIDGIEKQLQNHPVEGVVDHLYKALSCAR